MCAYDIEQYKILWDTLNGEMQRFWFRFNVLIGVEIGAALLVLKTWEGFGDDILGKGFLLLIMTSFAVITCLIVFRAISIYRLLVCSISELEDREETKNSLYLVTILKSVAEREHISNISSPAAMHFASIISVIFFMAWLFSFLFVVMGVS